MANPDAVARLVERLRAKWIRKGDGDAAAALIEAGAVAVDLLRDLPTAAMYIACWDRAVAALGEENV